MTAARRDTTSLELLTIGTELLLGFTLDTNSAHIGRTLAHHGIRVTRRTSVGDTPEAIRTALAEALDRSGAVLTTGGLGPTRDDITRDAVAEVVGMPLEFDEAVWQMLLKRFERFGRVPAAINRVQAMVPRGATVLPNQWGSAPGLWIESPRGLVIMLPGVPIEMVNLLEHEVLPRLRPGAGNLVIRSATVRTTGIAESTLAERIGELEDALAPLGLAYLPGIEGVDLRLTAWQLPEEEAAARLQDGVARLQEVVGEFAYGEGEADLAGVVLDRLREKGLHLAVAESCTGGLLAGRLTDVPGASEVFLGGVVAYANAAKEALLMVPNETLTTHGAVSAETAEAMARGAAARLGAEVAASVTGIAGPGGGTPEKPVGTVWFGYAVRGEVASEKRKFVGTRAEIRARAAQAALQGVLRFVKREA